MAISADGEFLIGTTEYPEELSSVGLRGGHQSMARSSPADDIDEWFIAFGGDQQEPEYVIRWRGFALAWQNYRFVAVPVWFPAAAFAVLPFFFLTSWLLTRRGTSSRPLPRLIWPTLWLPLLALFFYFLELPGRDLYDRDTIHSMLFDATILASVALCLWAAWRFVRKTTGTLHAGARGFEIIPIVLEEASST